MRNRQPFEPGRLLGGLVLLLTATLYALDATGHLRARPMALLPLVPAGLLVAAVVGGLWHMFRRYRRRRATPPAVPAAARPAANGGLDWATDGSADAEPAVASTSEPYGWGADAEPSEPADDKEAASRRPDLAADPGADAGAADPGRTDAAGERSVRDRSEGTDS